MIHEHGDIVMVKIPEANRQIHEYVLNSIPEAGLSWLHFLDVNGDDCARQEEFIGNNYTLIGKGNELSEDEWIKVVATCYVWMYDDGNELFYKDYTDSQQLISSDYTLETATESGLSLLKSKGMKPENCLLLKKNKP